MVDRLTKVGFVQRLGSQTDRRVVNVSLTTSGKNVLQRFRKLLLPWAKENLAVPLSSEELAAPGGALESLLKGHGRWDGQMKHSNNHSR